MSDEADQGTPLQTSPLHERHVALGAKLAPFGGWQMPLEYAGGGVVREHTAVREAVGLFDVSHLGTAEVRGPGAVAHLDGLLTNDLARIGPGQAQYTLLCDDETGGVVDDLIVYLHDAERAMLVPNAANSAEVLRRVRESAPEGVEVEDLHAARAVLAVQGPRAEDVLREVGLPVGHDYMSFVEADLDGASVVVCRTGYTGEVGYELVVDASSAVAVWDALVAAGAAYGLVACGLGARDTLRTEMGYPLHGQDISPDVTPVQARLGWAVGWDKPRFAGKDVLVAERAAKPSRLLRGLLAQVRAIPRPGMQVTTTDGTPVGTVTSGTFSPTLKQGVALALLDRAVGLDDEVLVDVRGRGQSFVVTKPPFVVTDVRA
ncbi:glycine cleavage system aminomethyltransferase GcvT [Nocardioides aequoreus]|uniref:glycine cleavage system aminomethyltransferase GcvT n=1 Tax=Nocardioides aequoreus TaxID=397278 RepID=UPI0004C36D85|nr:glycine cleavage system aminomethyltransferase GcvT [Nocardioides aequoreus]